jgi:ribosomal protein S18 acetylase RimI-like enzyme
MESLQPCQIHEVDITDLATARRVHALQLAAYAVEAALIGYPALPPLHETPADLQHSGERFLACRQGEEIVGAASFVLDAGVLDIGRMVVSPTQARRGIGKRLLRALETIAGEGMTVTVSTAEKNIPAVRLYEGAGYRLVERVTLPDGLVIVRFCKKTQ